MRYIQSFIVPAICLASLWGVGGCGSVGSMSAGKMEWVAPNTDAPRAGTVYLVRGWVGLFSGGMDNLGRGISDSGVTAHVFQHDQCAELARTMAQRYKQARNPEPICMVGHSFGSDDALIIARELDKVHVPVDLIITMDPVNETVVPKNVRLCYNYWQPGIFGSSNFLRGIPLKQESGSTGKLYNVNLLEDGRDLRDFTTTHINIDDAPKLHKAIIDHILEVCPTRQTWVAEHVGQGRYVAAPVNDRAILAEQRLQAPTSAPSNLTPAIVSRAH